MSQMIFDQRNASGGNSISIDFVKNVGFTNTLNQINVGTAGTTVPNFSLGSLVLVNITANVAVTVGTPINMPVPFGPGQTSVGFEWQLFIQNSSGVTLTTAPALGAIFRIQGTLPVATSWTNGVGITSSFFWDGVHHTALAQVTSATF